MKVTIFVLLTIIAVATVVFALTEIIKRGFNIRALKNANDNPRVLIQRHGIVFNKKSGKLEADQSPITPF